MTKILNYDEFSMNEGADFVHAPLLFIYSEYIVGAGGLEPPYGRGLSAPTA